MENTTQKKSMEQYSTNQAKLDFFAMIKTDKFAKEFDTYYKELVAYNENVNLTAITEESEVYIKHFYDSCLPFEMLPQGASVVDVGTGAGFPGIPLKIVRPDIKLTLVDSLQKRVVFLDELCKKLNVQSYNTHARAEDFAIKNKAKFDVAVARAVAKLNTLLEYLLPLVKVGG
ncbi:MAG: 16S rRNA (guanine(527)-N(7))-methyltransferase RsmG, partial [Clostridia bacterium]|nr:16S rRNA (guanine(527)-N(7))-methyltransferase RsmG [Clostridia bacterium]